MAKLSSTQIYGDLQVDGEIKNKATTTSEGVVQLNDNVNSTSTTQGATANAVKKVNDSLSSHKIDTTSHITASERTTWNEKLDKTGGTVSGKLRLKNGSFVATCNAGAGSSGYIKILQLKINTKTYPNQPIVIKLFQRSTRLSRLTIRFPNTVSTDPSLETFSYLGDVTAYIHKVDVGTWDIYVKKRDNYDSIAITELHKGEYMDLVTITYKNELVTELPSGCIGATIETLSVGGNASTATKLQTARTINGVSFDGTANITVADSTKLPLSGGTVTGNLVVNGSMQGAVKNYYTSRQASANLPVVGDGTVKHFLSTSSMTTGKPAHDGYITHFEWDNTGGWTAQLFLPANATGKMQFRSMSSGTWGSWHSVYSTNNKPTPAEIGASPTEGSTSLSKLAKDITLGDGATFSITQNNGTWWQKIGTNDTEDRSVHRFFFSERQGSGDYVELFGVDGNGDIYAKNRKVYHTGNKPTISDLGLSANKGAGENSVMFNNLGTNVASGQYSFAQGSVSQATDFCAFAEGCATTASGNSSHAEGTSTTASGQCGHAEGWATKAIGFASHVEGDTTIAYNGTCHAEGYMSVAGLSTITSDTYCAHAEGYKTTASAQGSHSEGYSTKATSTASHAEGNGTTASGTASHAEGNTTTASGSGSHAEGYQTKATGTYSHAEGHYTKASDNYTHAEGSYTEASYQYAHAEGRSTKATGTASHSQGSSTTASGANSHAEGDSTTAETYAMHSQGRYNKVNSGTATSYSATNNAFVIGNGTAMAYTSNAFRVDFSGRTYGLSAFNSTGADYAEYFEWLDGNPNNEDRIGHFVALDGEKIRFANSEDDYIIGIISGNQSIIGNACEDSWNDMYIRDEFGRLQYEDVEVEQEEDVVDEETQQPKTIVKKVIEHHIKLNPNYTPSKEYKPRSERKEWGVVGMLGQIIVKDDGTCKVNGYCKPSKNGIATASDDKSHYRVMSRISDNLVKVIMK